MSYFGSETNKTVNCTRISQNHILKQDKRFYTVHMWMSYKHYIIVFRRFFMKINRKYLSSTFSYKLASETHTTEFNTRDFQCEVSQSIKRTDLIRPQNRNYYHLDRQEKLCLGAYGNSKYPGLAMSLVNVSLKF